MGGSDDHYNRTVAIFVGLFVGFGGFLYGASSRFWYCVVATDERVSCLLGTGYDTGAYLSSPLHLA